MIACDSHVHVFGPRDRYPQVETRAYTAGVAAIDTLRRRAAPVGVQRFVVVQASVNGADNSCLLDTLDVLAGSGRGVVVAEAATIERATLEDWGRRGVRGLRINLYSDYKGGSAARPGVAERFRSLGAVTPRGWHIELIAPLPVLADAAVLLADSRVPVVIDHYGLPGTERPDGRNGRALIDLLKQRHIWLKLSAPYRAAERPGSNPLLTTPPQEWIEALLDVAPDRLVWGSDWPHTPAHEHSRHGADADPFRAIDYGQLFREFSAAISERRTLEAVLDANPARLYGFA